MPDPLKQTVSASQVAALFNASPYFTRWMLYQNFAHGMPLDRKPDTRMTWGSKLEPLIIAQAAEELALECWPTHDYVRAGLLGATRDVTILCPDRGPGALESKAIFDWPTWMREWDGGRTVPRHIEIQLQQQMLVGDGDRHSWRWGIVVAWVCGEVHYFERQPLPQLWDRLERAAADFFADIAAGNEPDPFGVPVELPWLLQMFPTHHREVLDLAAEERGGELAAVALAYREARANQSAAERTCEPLRAHILAVAKSAEEVICRSGIRIRITSAGRGKRISVYVPETAGAVPADVPIEELLRAG
jgi:hypothetical protein